MDVSKTVESHQSSLKRKKLKKSWYKRAIEVEAWFTAPHAIEAPRRNSALLKSLLQLSNKAVSNATYQHLHSLSEEQITFSFFDDAILFETKQHVNAKL